MSTRAIKRRAPAFTLIELLVSLIIAGILISITATTYSIFRKAIAADQAKADITQNARVALDRIARELRQTPDIVTQLPASASDNSVAQPGEIEFEDGHDNNLTYERYYVTGGTLEMDTIEYYFSYDTGTRVNWNSVGNGGVDPVEHVISTQDVADRLQSLTVYGSKPITVIVTTTDGLNQTFMLRTNVYERNV